MTAGRPGDFLGYVRVSTADQDSALSRSWPVVFHFHGHAVAFVVNQLDFEGDVFGPLATTVSSRISTGGLTLTTCP